MITKGSTTEAMWVPTMIVQASTSFFGLVVLPAIFMMRQGVSVPKLLKAPFDLKLAFLTIFILLSFLVVDSIIVTWNADLDLPGWMDGFEAMARKWEDSHTAMTEFITGFKTFNMFLLGIFVIGVLPALGEEIMFRGIIQNELNRGTRNIHVSIWFTAILFSAIHFQFFGFFPRMLLGALFGYLYYWSGSLWMPIFAHLLNNGAIVTALYLHQQGKITIDLEDQTAAPWPSIAISAVVLVALLFVFKRSATGKIADPPVAADNSERTID
jgi:uncharacterized protein